MLNLVKTVVISKNQTMGIYEVPEDLQEKYGGKYFLSSALFSDRWLQTHTAEEFLDCAMPQHYEGFFETQKEAYLTAMLVKASVELNAIRYALEDLKKVEVPNLEWDF